MEENFLSFKKELDFFSNSFCRFSWLFLSLFFWFFYLSLSFLFLISEGFYLGLLLFLIFLVNLRYHLSNKKDLDSFSLKTDKEKINYFDYFSWQAKKIIINISLLALKEKKNFEIILLFSLSRDKDVQKIFQELDIKKDKLKKEVSFLEEIPEEREKDSLLREIFSLIEISFLVAKEIKSQKIEPYHFLLALAKKKNRSLRKILLHLSLTFEDLFDAARLLSLEKRLRPLSFFRPSPKKISHRIMNRSWTAKATPILDSFSLDLTDLAREKEIGFLVNHQEEIDRLIDILARDFKNNVLLVGLEGSGKESLVNFLAWQIVKDDVPAKLFDKRLVKLNLGALVSGLKTPGEIRERGEKVVKEIASAKNIILFLPEIDQFFKKEDVSFLKEIFSLYLRNATFQVIATISPRALSKYESSNQDFLNLFERIEVKEISVKDALTVLIFFSFFLEKKHKIEISLKSLKRAVNLAKIYNPQKLLPSGAIELLDEAVKELIDRKENYLQASLINEIVERKTKIPLTTLSPKKKEFFLNLEEEIHKVYVNQEEAVKTVSRALRTYLSGLKERNKPIASLLFVGPTGVGKTYLAKILTKILFGKEELIVRFDMSKYQTKFDLWKFIGSPEGEEGKLTKAIRNKPYSVLLLDEFEKASREIQNLFLPIFDEGFIIDNNSNKLNFTNSLIIATSNAHSLFLIEEMRKGRQFSEIVLEFKNLLVKDFPPELLNRFSGLAVFRPLSKEEIKKVTLLNLELLKKIIAEKHHYSLSFSSRVIEVLAEKGYSQEFGVRPLKYVIKKEIRGLLAREILKNSWLPGTNLFVDWQENQFVVIANQGSQINN